jgi:hypothetical protein
VTIKIGKGYGASAVRGTIWLDADLLETGRFAWGTVQHEYGHQVDFFLLDEAKRMRLSARLGGNCWWQTCAGRHEDLTSERFASTLAWSYWPSSYNTMKPESPNDESAAMKPAAFRALMRELLGVPDLVGAQRAQQASIWMATKPKPSKAAKKIRPEISSGRRNRP